MDSIYCVQVIKAGIFPVLVIAVLNGAVRKPRKYMVALQSVAKGGCPVCDMAFKYINQFLCAGFCAVDSGGNCIPFTLDACADIHIFIGDSPFFRFFAMSARSSGNEDFQFFPL